MSKDKFNKFLKENQPKLIDRDYLLCRAQKKILKKINDGMILTTLYTPYLLFIIEYRKDFVFRQGY